MKTWIVRFATLYVFNVVVLLVIGLLTPASVGWAVFWAAALMALLELFVKPLVLKMFRSSASKGVHRRTRAGEAIVQGILVLAVAAIVWVLTLLLSGVSAGGSWFWAWVLPPILITIGWAIYAKVSGSLEQRAGELYDRAGGGPAVRPANETATINATNTAAESPEKAAARKELRDGLTPEQRKMFDDLDNS